MPIRNASLLYSRQVCRGDGACTAWDAESREESFDCWKLLAIFAATKPGESPNHQISSRLSVRITRLSRRVPEDMEAYMLIAWEFWRAKRLMAKTGGINNEKSKQAIFGKSVG